MMQCTDMTILEKAMYLVMLDLKLDLMLITNTWKRSQYLRKNFER
jgi:hypothetical protein